MMHETWFTWTAFALSIAMPLGFLFRVSSGFRYAVFWRPWYFATRVATEAVVPPALYWSARVYHAVRRAVAYPFVLVAYGLREAAYRMGYLVTRDGRYFPYRKAGQRWPRDLRLTVSHRPLVLPLGLTVAGDLDLRDSWVYALPRGLYVLGTIRLDRVTGLFDLPEDIYWSGLLCSGDPGAHSMRDYRRICLSLEDPAEMRRLPRLAGHSGGSWIHGAAARRVLGGMSYNDG